MLIAEVNLLLWNSPVDQLINKYDDRDHLHLSIIIKIICYLLEFYQLTLQYSGRQVNGDQGLSQYSLQI